MKIESTMTPLPVRTHSLLRRICPLTIVIAALVLTLAWIGLLGYAFVTLMIFLI